VRNWLPKAPTLTDCGRYSFRNVKGCGSITMDGSFQWGDGPERNFYIHDVDFTNVELKPGSEISLKYCERITFKHVRCSDGRPPAYILDGKNYDTRVDGAVLAP
jgi:hypothetical protein